MSDKAKLTITDSRAEFSLLKLSNPDPIAVVSPFGRVFVYTKGGNKLDTGVVMKLPIPDGYMGVYEVLRALGLKCATISNTTE